MIKVRQNSDEPCDTVDVGAVAKNGIGSMSIVAKHPACYLELIEAIQGGMMSYSFEWITPNRVILFTLGETYTLEDAGRLNEQMLEMLNQSIQPLHMLIDLTAMRHFPMRLTEEVWAITKCLRHSQMGWLLAINHGANPMAHFIGTVVGKTTGVKLRFVKSLEEALETLQRVDLTL